jgi:hypothetical protein
MQNPQQAIKCSFHQPPWIAQLNFDQGVNPIKRQQIRMKLKNTKIIKIYHYILS